MNRFLRGLERLPRPAVYALAVSLIGLVAFVDWVTGEDVSVSIFYVPPVLVVTWLFGLRPGLALNALCAPIRLLLVVRWQGPYPLSRPGLYWNLLIEGAFALALTFLMAALKAEHARQSLLARTDPLTGVANRRAFYERAELELSRIRRLAEPLTLGYVDIDDFKRINDELGHEAGDSLLRAVAGTFAGRVRGTDLVARLGGDEFALLLPASGVEASRALFSELSRTLAGEMARSSWLVTFSIGAVTFVAPPVSVDEMLRCVDDLMYLVKRDGKAGILYEVVSDASRRTPARAGFRDSFPAGAAGPAP